LPGRVWATAEPAWIEDVTADRNFPRAPAAAREGLHGAFAFPVVLRGDVLSVMEFFSLQVRRPNEELLSTLRTVGQQIGMFTDRRRAQEELDRFFVLSLEMMCVAGFDGYFKRVNPAWQRVLGYTEEELLSRPYMEFVHPDDREATTREAGRASEGQDVVYSKIASCTRTARIAGCSGQRRRTSSSRSSTRPRTTLPNGRRPTTRWRSTRVISRPPITSWNSRPLGSRSS
jgi:PAS domain S-box-containing protein